MLKPKKSQKTRNDCDSINIIVHKDPQSLSSLLNKTLDVKMPTKPRARTR
jgi:hypothetical protein